jgi:hypothetical protein
MGEMNIKSKLLTVDNRGGINKATNMPLGEKGNL